VKTGTPSPTLSAASLAWGLLAVGVALYAGGFGWPPLSEDLSVVAGQDFLRNPRHLAVVLNPRYLFEILPVANAARPMWLASILLDRAVLGDSFAALRLSSALWHVLGAALLAALCWELCADAAAAAAAGFLFLVHPAHAEVVRIAAFRGDAVAFVFAALALLLHLKAWRLANPRPARAAALFVFALAVLSKESAAALPLLLPVVDLASSSAPRPWTRRLRVYGAFFLVLAAYLYFRVPRAGYESSDGADVFTSLQESAPGLFAPVSRPSPDFPNRAPQDGRMRDPRPWMQGFLNPWTRARTMTAVLGSSLRRLWWPQPLQGDYAPKLVLSWFDRRAAAALAAWALLVGVAVFERRRNPMFAAGLAWIPAALAPVSGIVMMRNLTADRYLYFASAGVCLALAALIAAPPSAGPQARRAALILCGTVAVFWAALVHLRAPVFRSDEDYFAATVAVDPDVPRARYNLGIAQWRAGWLKSADENLRAAYELWPESRKVREAYAHFLSSRGRANEARAVLDAAP
jgi:hypothetical protein